MRSQTDNNSGARIFLLGSTVLLVGVGAMFAIRMYNIPGEDLAVASNLVIYGDGGKTSALEPAPANPDNPAKMSGDDSDLSALGVKTVQQPDDEQAVPSNVDELVGGSTESSTVIAISPQQLLMARMTDLVVNVIGFPEDSRGTVATAIEASTQGAMQSCKLTCVQGSNKPVMQVSLKLINDSGVDTLFVAAELQASLQGIPVKLWERKESLIALDDKALQNGILPPNLDRSLSRFFTTLRSDLVDARRTVVTMENAQKQRVNEKP